VSHELQVDVQSRALIGIINAYESLCDADASHVTYVIIKEIVELSRKIRLRHCQAGKGHRFAIDWTWLRRQHLCERPISPIVIDMTKRYGISYVVHLPHTISNWTSNRHLNSVRQTFSIRQTFSQTGSIGEVYSTRQ
jgi:hypothetical protein